MRLLIRRASAQMKVLSRFEPLAIQYSLDLGIRKKSGSSMAGRYRQVGMAPQFQDQLRAGKMHGSMGVSQYRSALLTTWRKSCCDRRRRTFAERTCGRAASAYTSNSCARATAMRIASRSRRGRRNSASASAATPSPCRSTSRACGRPARKRRRYKSASGSSTWFPTNCTPCRSLMTTSASNASAA